MKVYFNDLNNTIIDLDRSPFLAKGGEALVYQLPNGQVFKLFKEPDHPDYQGNPVEQDMARERLIVHRQKLPELQKLQLPFNVVTPLCLGYKSKNVRSLCGFSMRGISNAGTLIQLLNGKYQASLNLTKDMVLEFLVNLRETVLELHKRQVIIGDFNPLNVLFDNDVQNGIRHHMIDADSYQFGTFLCNTFTFGYVDPKVCDSDLILVKPHTTLTDWYAFTVMVMRALLFTGPYDGIHKPKNGQRLQGKRRVLQRKTIFDNEIVYPKPAYPYTRLPDTLLQYFDQVFKQDHRDVFPLDLLQFQWTTCTKCPTEHARAVCPQCTNPSPLAIVQKTTVKDGVVASQIFSTEGTILYATVENEEIRYVYQIQGRAYRENKTQIYQGTCHLMRYRIAGDLTYMGRGQMFTDTEQNFQNSSHVDPAFGIPMFDVGGDHFYWIDNGKLYRRTRRPLNFMERQIKDHVVNGIADQTIIYMGKDIGLGWYMAGALPVVFVIHPSVHGAINIQIGAIKGKLIDHACYFGKDRIWFFVHYVYAGRETVRCILIRNNGTIDATMESVVEPDSWFKNIQGVCCIGPYLFAPTDNGIVRVEAAKTIGITKEFESTAPFVDSESKLLPGKNGIYVVNTRAITLLKL